MTFRELQVGQRFEFDHAGLAPHLASSLMSGPWVKVADRAYRHEDAPHEYTVGVRTVAVVLLPDEA